MPEKPELHVSMLSMMSRCGIQFQRRYGARFDIWPEEEIIPPGIALTVGIATHAAVEANLRHKLAEGELLEREAVLTAARDAYEGVWGKGVLLTDDEAADMSKVKGAAVDQTVGLAGVHYDDVAPAIKPAAIEEPFKIELEGYNFDLGGRIDILEDTGEIRDTKTSRATPSGGENAAKTMQMAMYALSRKVIIGEYPKLVSVDYLIKTKTPKAISFKATPDDSWVDPLLRRVERAMEIIETVREGKQAMAPAQPDDWQCSKRYCGYAESCPFWSGR